MPAVGNSVYRCAGQCDGARQFTQERLVAFLLALLAFRHAIVKMAYGKPTDTSTTVLFLLT
ncbi:MAG: hypothetical protein Q8S29_13550, partial [Phreatobacter sp.]|nr:hypothetical protein [Phreatobacter sp.]